MNSFATVCYVPPRGKCHSEAFVRNLAAYKTRYPLFLLSDDPGWQPVKLIPNPELAGRRPHWGINNRIWFAALEFAGATGLEHFFFAESDSRVMGDYWDEAILADYLGRYPDGIDCAGSPVIWHPVNSGWEFGFRLVELAHAFQEATHIPAAIYGGRDPRACGGTIVYPNGSLAVYSTRAMQEMFGDCIGQPHRHIHPYDFELGVRLVARYGMDATEHVGYLTKAYSGFGDCVLNEIDRQQLLLTGRMRAVHQFKGDFSP